MLLHHIEAVKEWNNQRLKNLLLLAQPRKNESEFAIEEHCNPRDIDFSLKHIVGQSFDI